MVCGAEVSACYSISLFAPLIQTAKMFARLHGNAAQCTWIFFWSEFFCVDFFGVILFDVCLMFVVESAAWIKSKYNVLPAHCSAINLNATDLQSFVAG